VQHLSAIREQLADVLFSNRLEKDREREREGEREREEERGGEREKER
jgi:hypothetical protein